jgi:hypothetical protein
MQLLVNNNNDLPTKENELATCPDPIPVTTTGVPGVSDDDRLELTTQQSTGIRTFDCLGDRPTYSEFKAKISDIKGDWWGEMYYDENGFPIFELNWLDPYSGSNKIASRKVVTFKEFVEIPSPDGAASWARYRVLSDDGKPLPFKYVERAFTKGGEAPPSCGGLAKVEVPFQAYYYFYLCKDPKQEEEASPVLEPSPEPVTPSPEPASPEPASPKPASPEPASPEPATPEPASPEPSVDAPEPPVDISTTTGQESSSSSRATALLAGAMTFFLFIILL